MRSTTIEEQALHILRKPLLLSFVGLVLACLIVVGFHVDNVHVILSLILLAVAVFTAIQLSKFLARHFSEHVASSVELLHAQVEGVLLADRDFEFHSDVTETMVLAESVQKLYNRVAEVRQEMRGLEHVRSQFLANVSHELRTPVFAIQGYLETLMEGAEDDVRVRHTFLEKAHNNAQRLNVLLGDLIDISRIESGEMRLSFRYFTIADVAHDVCSALDGLANQYSVSLSVRCEDPEVLALGDKERITQVLANLVSNAVRYNRPQGTVEIGIEKEEHDVVIRVRDTGIGIAPEHQARIFERFYRVDTNRSRTTGGSGLGLAIVKHILEAHETEPEIESEEGKGTTISFRLRR